MSVADTKALDFQNSADTEHPCLPFYVAASDVFPTIRNLHFVFIGTQKLLSIIFSNKLLKKHSFLLKSRGFCGIIFVKDRRSIVCPKGMISV